MPWGVVMRTVAAVAEATVSAIHGLTPKGAAMTGDLATSILTFTTMELLG